jgi:hypothetical protein
MGKNQETISSPGGAEESADIERTVAPLGLDRFPNGFPGLTPWAANFFDALRRKLITQTNFRTL